MIELWMLWVWLVPMLVTFRYTGYSQNAKILEYEHSGAIICVFCRCTECGRARSKHVYSDRHCSVYYGQNGHWRGMHPTSFALGLLLANLWPLLLLKLGAKAVGITKPGISYFAPPPEIKSREERRAEREAEKDERIKALQTRNAELEKEMGIGA